MIWAFLICVKVHWNQNFIHIERNNYLLEQWLLVEWHLLLHRSPSLRQEHLLEEQSPAHLQSDFWIGFWNPDPDRKALTREIVSGFSGNSGAFALHDDNYCRLIGFSNSPFSFKSVQLFSLIFSTLAGIFLGAIFARSTLGMGRDTTSPTCNSGILAILDSKYDFVFS